MFHYYRDLVCRLARLLPTLMPSWSFGEDAMREHHDASGRLSIALGDDGPMFSTYASRLEQFCKARRLRQLDGPDQKYWDFDLDGTTVVLH